MNARNSIRLVFICIFFILSHYSFSQQRVWSSKMNSLKVFIENKGQFNEPEFEGNKVEYCYLGSQEKFYFTKKGVTINLEKISKKNNPASWVKKLFTKEMEEDETVSVSKSMIDAEWINTNEEYSIETEGCSEGYYTFDKSQEISYGYKKLIYKNIYPNIDVVYTIPEDSSGIEYSLIVRPGADLTKVKLQYNGDIHQMKLVNGNIEIETPSGKITEHAPASFYENEKTNITSSFELKNKIISFQLSDRDINKVLIIDPWVSGINITASDIAYNVDYDDNSNLYAYIRSSNSSLYVNKYSSTGVFQWSHVITSSTQYEGDFLVDKLTGRVFISEGFNGSGAYVYSISNSGVSDGWVSQTNSGYVEIWEMLYDDTKDNIIAVGGGTQTNLTGGIINIVTGIVNIANFTGFGGICQDIVCGTTDNQGKLFVIYAQTICGVAGQIDNKIELVNNTLNGPVWLEPSGFNAFLESANHVPPAGAQTCNGFNALAVNDNYLYYYDGGGLAAYNKLDGSVVASTSVNYMGTYYTTLNQGGIAVNECDHVYIGGPDDNLLMIKFNGTSFTSPVNLPLGWSGPDSAVYDVKLDRDNQLLFVSGTNNVGVYDVLLDCTTKINTTTTEEENIQVFPNPASLYTTVRINTPGVNVLEIIDITGKVIKSFEMENEINIYTGDLASGEYLIKILGKKNENNKSVKLSVP